MKPREPVGDVMTASIASGLVASTRRGDEVRVLRVLNMDVPSSHFLERVPILYGRGCLSRVREIGDLETLRFRAGREA